MTNDARNHGRKMHDFSLSTRSNSYTRFSLHVFFKLIIIIINSKFATVYLREDQMNTAINKDTE